MKARHFRHCQEQRRPWLAVLLLLLLLLLLSMDVGCRAFLFRMEVPARIRVRRKSNGPFFVVDDTRSDANTANTANTLLVHLPIFPLRKYPRLPTDSLTLNLYEDRYLQMSKESILSTTTRSERPVFGALYVADLPQIVPKGRGPITPMLQVGRIGTLFVVEDSHHDRIPNVTGQEFYRHRRHSIRLQARGVARFRIDTIVSDGTGGLVVDDASANNENLPYLVVNATLILDDTVRIFQPSDGMESLGVPRITISETPVWNKLVTPSQPTSTQHVLSEFESIFSVIQRLIPAEQWCLDQDCYRNELFSFFLVSQSIPAAGKQQRRKDVAPLLKMTSSQERVDALKQLF
jgi:hypothetical protein